ncbi:hypothetical protein M1M07_23905 [Rhodococcus sp. HM1]|uniref:hypothetical protein n=1 Tax=Rhodococcus sp. HM1 TaxID=2937759 RepID=UPI00200B5E83|nr:hypothetical protein [Rhodococcus sp. HM1]MCK8674143.1 hypothetical protein [Rhodococcus sp. HM1]
MLGRFDLSPIFRAHWKVLSKDTSDGTVPDWPARFGLLIPSIVAPGVMIVCGWSLAQPTALLTAVALLAGALIAAFAELSSLRIKLGERYDPGEQDGENDKAAIDESVTHVLFASFLLFVNAAVLTIGLVMAPEDAKSLAGPAAWISAGLFTYTVILALMLIPRLLYAYTQANRVRDDLNGFYIRR